MPAVSDSPARVLLKVASTGLQPRRQQQPPCGAKEETTTMQTIGTETHNVEDVRQYVDDAPIATCGFSFALRQVDVEHEPFVARVRLQPRTADDRNTKRSSASGKRALDRRSKAAEKATVTAPLDVVPMVIVPISDPNRSGALGAEQLL